MSILCKTRALGASILSGQTQTMPFPEFVAMLAFLMSVAALSIDAMLPALPMIASDLAVTSPNHAQYVVSFLFLGLTIGQIIYGPLSDTIGRKPCIYLGLGLLMIGCVMSIKAPSYDLMLAGRFLQGFGVSSPRTISLAMARDVYQGPKMARLMSYVMAIFIIVPALAPTIGQTVLQISSWHGIFMFLMGTAFIALIWMHFRLNETLAPDKRRPLTLSGLIADTKTVCTHPVTMGYTVCIGFVFSAMIAYISSAQQIFQDYFQLGERFPLFFGITALSIGLAAVVNAQLVKRFKMRSIVHYALITMLIIATITIGVTFALPTTLPLGIFMIYMVITFFCIGLLFGNLNAIALSPMGELAGIASAVIGALSSVVSVICGTMIGQMYNHTLWPMLLGFFILTLLTFVMQLRLRELPE